MRALLESSDVATENRDQRDFVRTVLVRNQSGNRIVAWLHGRHLNRKLFLVQDLLWGRSGDSRLPEEIERGGNTDPLVAIFLMKA